MKIEIRDDAVVIDGYVNAVERDSKVLRGKTGAFIERIKAGAFRRALERAKRTSYDVKVLLNHDYDRELTSTRDATTKITEDAIGLRCKCEIRDKEVIEKARAGKLRGWSFGFFCLREDRKKSNDGEIEHRDVKELELREVSILDDTKIPAYDGTSIETRSEDIDDFIEIRMISDEVEVVENQKQSKCDDLFLWENRYLATRASL